MRGVFPFIPAILLVVLLAGCANLRSPFSSEDVGKEDTGRESCIRSCNRTFTLCGEQGGADASTGTTGDYYGAAQRGVIAYSSACDANLKSCLKSCH
jgi:hypothetical protein